MNRKDITRHKKRKKNKLKLLFWGILFAFVAVLVMYLFSLGGKSIGEILSYKNYWLSVGVANGLILIGYLMMYRVDAQNIALNENDLEDTEWLSVKRLKKLKEFQVYDYKSAEEKTDGIVIGAEKKGGSVEVITTSQLHALIVGTTGSGTQDYARHEKACQRRPNLWFSSLTPYANKKNHLQRQVVFRLAGAAGFEPTQ